MGLPVATHVEYSFILSAIGYLVSFTLTVFFLHKMAADLLLILILVI